MSLDDFMQDPSKNSHSQYQSSLFASTAPEYSTGEVLLGSVYRKLIFDESESAINLEEIPTLPLRFQSKNLGSAGLWGILLQQGGIGSPTPKRSKLPQLMPLVPEIALHACVLGSQRSRWNPANLLLETIGAGYGKKRGEELIVKLGQAIEVGNEDDIFARFVENSFRGINEKPLSASNYTRIILREEKNRSDISAHRGKESEFLNPAERFCKDLEVIIAQKNILSRRQWTVLLEATLRIGLGMHLLWTCQVNSIVWHWLLSLSGNTISPLTEDEIEFKLWQSHREISPLLQVGSPAMPLVEQLIRNYVEARFGINLILHKLEEQGLGWTQIIGYSSCEKVPAARKIGSFLEHVYQNRFSIDKNPEGWLRENCARLLEENSDLIKLDSGFPKNMREYIRHSLGQIDARDPEQKSYDQAYLIRNKSTAKRETFLSVVVNPGPAMLISLVNACYHEKDKRLASLEDLRMHFSDYGLHVPAGELSGGQVGKDLQKLGLVVDSPDAAGGRLLVPPFNSTLRS